MRIVYCGGHDAVDLPLPGGGYLTVPRGGAVDVPDGFAKSLLEQASNWSAASPAKPKPAAAAGEKE